MVERANISDMGTRGSKVRGGGRTRKHINIVAGVLTIALVLVLMVLGQEVPGDHLTPTALIEQQDGVQKARCLLKATASKNDCNWPGVPVKKVGNILVKKGHNFVENTHELLLSHLDEFLDVHEKCEHVWHPHQSCMCTLVVLQGPETKDNH
jgi:hypothetical protein